MTRERKRELLAERQRVLMQLEDKKTMLVCYGDRMGDPGYCVTIERDDGTQEAYWFSGAERFGGVDEWLSEQNSPGA